MIDKFPTLYLAICYLGSKPGRKPVLSTDIERSISLKITTVADKGFGISHAQVMLKAALVAKMLSWSTCLKMDLQGKIGSVDLRNGTKTLPLASHKN